MPVIHACHLHVHTLLPINIAVQVLLAVDTTVHILTN